MKHVIAFVGPTASGKTDLAIEVAGTLGTEIVSADSMQFYRGMEIGTGQPSPDQLARVKHHFIGHLAPDAFMSAADFATAAREVIARINASGKPAVVVGGSGLYIRALIDGLFEGPGRSCEIRQRLHAQADAEGIPVLYAQLHALDPAYAGKVLPGDLRRIVRALEVYELTGKTLSTHHAEQQLQQAGARAPLDAARFAIDWLRDVLYARITRRVESMFAAGLVREVEALLAAGHEPQMQRLKSLGYREILAYLRGETKLEATIAAVQMLHRRYAKRQLTWFRRDAGIRWLPMARNGIVVDFKLVVDSVLNTWCV